jgi:sRNA-binding carbon storage regulator CsrA
MVVVVQRVGQRIYIGEHVILTIVSIHGNYIKVSVEGPGVTIAV